MTVPIEHFLADIGEERRAAIEAGAAQIVAEQQTLAALRRARGLTQAQVAELMETSQANVAQIERKDDILLSTIARVVRAIGGELEINARFKNATVPLKIGRDGSVSARYPKSPAAQAPSKQRNKNAFAPERQNTIRPAVGVQRAVAEALKRFTILKNTNERSYLERVSTLETNNAIAIRDFEIQELGTVKLTKGFVTKTIEGRRQMRERSRADYVSMI